MKTTCIVGWVICLSMASLWFPSGTKSAPTGSMLCAGMADSIWDQKHKGMLPQNESTIDKVMKVKNDCPQLAGSMERIANDIRAHLQRQAEARQHLQQLPIYFGGGNQELPKE